MTDFLRIALHEAAHALAFFDCGVQVIELRAGPTGGLCGAGDLSRLDPSVIAFATAAGYHGPRLLGFEEAEPSDGDREILFRYCGLITRQERLALERRLEPWVWSRRDEITHLAHQLLQARLMLTDAIGAVVRRVGSPLRAYSHLYPAPVATPPPGEPERPDWLQPGDYWSPAHKCWLTRRRDARLVKTPAEE